jgi:hypothetical protein
MSDNMGKAVDKAYFSGEISRLLGITFFQTETTMSLIHSLSTPTRHFHRSLTPDLHKHFGVTTETFRLFPTFPRLITTINT